MKRTKFFASIFLLVFLMSFSYARLEVGLTDGATEGLIGLDLNLNPLDINYGGNYSINVNSSNLWVTSEGVMDNVADILHNWLDPDSLLWSNAEHIMDTFLYMDGNDIIDVGNINLSDTLTFVGGGFIEQANYLQFNTTWLDGSNEGRLQWNMEDGALEFGMPGGSVNLQIGQEMLSRSKNDKGSTIYDGQVVYISGASGGNLLIDTPIATNITQATRTFAVATESIDNNQLGYVTTTGVVRGIDTTAWNAGDLLWLSETEEGNLTTTIPTAPNTKVAVGVVRKVAGDGEISVDPSIIPRLISLSDVYPVGLQGASILRYNSTSNRWEISTSYTTDETDELIGGASLELYFKNTTSGISTYWDMNQSANGAPKNSSSVTLSADSTQIGGFISPNASDMGIAGLSNGIIDSHFHASVDLTTGKKDVSGYFEVYQRYGNGTEIFLTRSHLIEVDATSETEYEAHASLLKEVVLNDSDRIVMKLFANLSGSGGNPTLTTYIQGDTLARGDFSSLGVNFLTVGQADSNYVRQDGTTPIQPTVDSTIAFQMKDQAGNVDFNYDSTNGFFGLGILAPEALLHVYGTSNPDLRVESTNNAFNSIMSQSATGKSQFRLATNSVFRWAVGVDGTDSNKFKISSWSDVSTNERITIDLSTGNVGIGDTDPSRRLKVFSGQQIVSSFHTTITSPGRISVNNADTTADNKVGIGAEADDLLLFAGGSEAVRVLETGNVGIGTTSPQNKLDVAGAQVIGSSYAGVNTAPTDGLLVEGDVGIGTTTLTADLHVVDTNARASILAERIGTNVAKMEMAAANNVGEIGTTSNDPMNFIINGATKAHMDTSGNFGIGTDSPQNELNIIGDTNTTNNIYVGNNITLGNGAVIGYNSTCAFILYNQTGSVLSTQGCI